VESQDENGNYVGTWTVGDMEAGQTVTIEYDLKLKKDYFTAVDATAITNSAQVQYNGFDGETVCISEMYGGVMTVDEEAENNDTVVQTGADYTINVSKLINGEKDSKWTRKFSFTMEQEDTVAEDGTQNSLTAYMDADYQDAFTGKTVEITGTGEAELVHLYFREPGTYQFTLSEDNLSTGSSSESSTGDGAASADSEGEDADTENSSDGFTKDDSSYHITFVVTEDEYR
jgi:hypothetical protein